jgi:hypothetical protein
MIEPGPPSNDQITFDQAFLYCITLNHNNHKDWRLPTRMEYLHSGLVPSNSFDETDVRNSGDDSCQLLIYPVRDIK